MDIVGFLRDAAAGFVGAGLALAVIATLGKTIIGHWLAKELARYSASLETSELQRRVTIQRLDRERSEHISTLMAQSTKVQQMMLSAVDVTSASFGADPTELFGRRLDDLEKGLEDLTETALSGNHLFDAKEPFVTHLLFWALQVQKRIDRYRGDIGRLSASDAYAEKDASARAVELEAIRRGLFRDESLSTAFQKVLQRSREILGSEASSLGAVANVPLPARHQ